MSMSVVLDIIAVLFILVMTLIGAGKGFLKGLVGIIGIVVAGVVSYLLAGPVANILESMFGTTTALTSSLQSYFSGFEGLNVEIGDGSIAQAMTDNLHIPAFLSEFIFGKVIVITGYETTMTFAEVLSKTFAILIMQAVCDIGLFIILSIVMSVLVNILTKALRHISLLNYANTFLGMLLGAVKGLLVLCIVIFLLYLIPHQGLQTELSQTVVIQYIEQILVKIVPSI